MFIGPEVGDSKFYQNSGSHYENALCLNPEGNNLSFLGLGSF
jgi:hypothetical protein